MIVVRVELHSAKTGKVSEIARMKIDNISFFTRKLLGKSLPFSDTKAHYRVRTLRGRTKEALDREAVTREGYVENHRRNGIHVWNLIGKCITAAGYGEEKK